MKARRSIRGSGLPPWARICALFVLSVLLQSTALSSPATTEYDYRPSTADGIGKFYFNREIAHVMGYEGAAWLERATREQEERPDLLIAALDLKTGMSVADVGAGSGYLSKRLAIAVSPGMVLAEDVQPQMVELLRALAQQPHSRNVIPVLGTPNDPKLPIDNVDLAILVDVYHELEFPLEVVSHLLPSLKPGGQLVFVEYRGEDPKVPIKALHKMTVAQMRREMSAFPLTFIKADERLPLQHIIFFQKNHRAQNSDAKGPRVESMAIRGLAAEIIHK